MFKVHLAKNKFLNKETQLTLIKYTRPHILRSEYKFAIRVYLARNESICTEAQLILKKDNNSYIKHCLLENKTI